MRLGFVFTYLLVLSFTLLASLAGKGQTIPPGSYLPLIARPGTPPTEPQLPTPTPTITPTATPTGSVLVQSSNVFTSFTGLNTTYLVGEVLNQTSQNVEAVTIYAVLRDAAGTIVDGESAIAMMDTIPPDVESPFRMVFLDPPAFSSYELTVAWNHTSRVPDGLDILEAEPYFDSSDDFHVRGQVYNQTSDTRTFVKVFLTIYDSAGTVIGANYAYIGPDSLAPGQKVPFDVEVAAWKGKPDRSQVALYLAVAYDD